MFVHVFFRLEWERIRDGSRVAAGSVLAAAGPRSALCCSTSQAHRRCGPHTFSLAVWRLQLCLLDLLHASVVGARRVEKNSPYEPTKRKKRLSYRNGAAEESEDSRGDSGIRQLVYLLRSALLLPLKTDAQTVVFFWRGVRGEDPGAPRMTIFFLYKLREKINIFLLTKRHPPQKISSLGLGENWPMTQHATQLLILYANLHDQWLVYFSFSFFSRGLLRRWNDFYATNATEKHDHITAPLLLLFFEGY